MIIYQVNIKIRHTIELDWLNWMQSKHIPDVLATSLFYSHQISKEIDPVDSGYAGYQINYYCENKQQFQQYESNYASTLKAEHFSKYKGQFKAERKLFSVMSGK